MYENVKRFEDLLKINVEFLKGNIKKTYYYCDSFSGGEDSDSKHMSQVDILINLNQHLIYTTDGQSGQSDDSECQQRSYLDFLTTEDFAETLLPLLLTNKKLYVCAMYPDSIRNFDNVPKSELVNFSSDINNKRDKREMVLPLTIDNGIIYTRWKRRRFHDMIADTGGEFPRIDEIHRDLVHFCIICKDFNTTFTAAEILNSL